MAAVPRRTGEALGEARQVEVTVERTFRKPGPCQPALQRLACGAPVRLARRARTRSRRLPHHHQALPGVALEDGVGCGDEPCHHAARAGRNFPLQEDESGLVIQARRFVKHWTKYGRMSDQLAPIALPTISHLAAASTIP